MEPARLLADQTDLAEQASKVTDLFDLRINLLFFSDTEPAPVFQKRKRRTRNVPTTPRACRWPRTTTNHQARPGSPRPSPADKLPQQPPAVIMGIAVRRNRIPVQDLVLAGERHRLPG